MCSVCYAGHHAGCWLRNGRCSTFRCTGSPLHQTGISYLRALETALEAANAEPLTCRLCSQRVYGGRLLAKRTPAEPGRMESGLTFTISKNRGFDNQRASRFLLRGLFRQRSWSLPGCQLRCRSCGSCRMLYLWGIPIDEPFIAAARDAALDRYCSHCGSPLYPGELRLNDARFWSDTTPEFHSEWFLHNVLDRFIYNRWAVSVRSVPAASCVQCRYTEIAGRPIYRF